MNAWLSLFKFLSFRIGHRYLGGRLSEDWVNLDALEFVWDSLIISFGKGLMLGFCRFSQLSSIYCPLVQLGSFYGL